MWAALLDILFAIQEEAEDGAEKVLNAVTGYRLDNISLNVLLTKMRERFGECVAESASEHDNELRGAGSAGAAL